MMDQVRTNISPEMDHSFPRYPSATLCPGCKDMFRGKEPIGTGDYMRFMTENVVEAPLQELLECYICAALSSRLAQDLLSEESHTSKSIVRVSRALVYYSGHGGGYDTFGEALDNAQQQDGSLLATMFVQAWKTTYSHNDQSNFKLFRSSAAAHRSYFPLLQSTGSDSCLALGREWLMECCKDHHECNVTSGTVGSGDIKLPTRLLKLSDVDGGPLRLIHTSAMRSTTRPRYATLSHCWGDRKMPTLTMGNFSSLLEAGIQLDALPATFRDAVRVTQFLGLQYLWIDSLCIVQDSADDWNFESLTMADVYRGSYLNIAASASSDASQGLFRDRSITNICPVVLPVKYDRCDSFILTPKEASPFDHFDIGSHPLFSRGWVFQERLLSRTLHFGAVYNLWQCQRQILSERYPDRISSANGGKDSRSLLCHNEGIFSTEDTGSLWHELVKVYSKCALTFPSDRLVAIAGVAKSLGSPFVGAHERGTYYAGLWSMSLPKDLLWRSQERATTVASTPITTRRKPSWSWASIDGGVTFIHNQDPTLLSLFRVVDVQMTLRTPDPYSEVIDGKMVVAGVMLPYFGTLEDVMTTRLRLRRGNTVRVLRTVYIDLDPPYAAFPSVSSTDQSRPTAHFLPIAMSGLGGVGLIVQPVEETLDVFRRVGLFQVMADSGIMRRFLQDIIDGVVIDGQGSNSMEEPTRGVFTLI